MILHKLNINQMQGVANQIFATLGAQRQLVVVQPTKLTIAGAVGIHADLNIPLFQLQGAVVVGIVYVNEKYLKAFTDAEIRFILAHECAHIFNNHSITSVLWKIIEQAAKGERNENYLAVEIIKILLALNSPDSLPPNAKTLKEQEYEADAIAVQVTGDLQSAISCLSKLVGNDMSRPSHTWELFGMHLPAMTLGTRIEELRRRVVGTLWI